MTAPVAPAPEVAPELREQLEAWIGRLDDRAREPRTTTPQGLEVPPLSLPRDQAEGWYRQQLGMPGERPFTRGVYPGMYRSRHWTMRQYAGFGSAEASNERYRYLLEQGQTGLSVAFDLPTQMGYDSDAPMAAGEVGRVGVAIDTVEDMAVLLDSLPLERVSTSMTINATAGLLLAMYVVVADERGIARDQLSGTIQNDLLKEYIARGTYIFPPEPSLRITTDIFAFCADHVPSWNTISISGYHIREAGSTAAQEIAFTLADGVTYVQAALDRGLDLERFAPRLSFFFNAHNNLLEEVAKFRAARRLWARLMEERFGSTNPKVAKLRFHAQTGGSTLTAAQPLTNMARVTIQALSAVLGGVQSLHTNAYDEALSLPTEEAARLALRIQQILAYESGVTDNVDPLGGAFCIEDMTDRLEAEARRILGEIDDRGGMLAAIGEGWVQGEIHRAAFAAQRDLEEGKRRVVGVNCFETDEPLPEPAFVFDTDLETKQKERLAGVRAARDDARVTRAIAAITAAAQADDNLMPLFIEAIQARASIGEICAALRGVFGTYREVSVV